MELWVTSTEEPLHAFRHLLKVEDVLWFPSTCVFPYAELAVSNGRTSLVVIGILCEHLVSPDAKRLAPV